MEVKLDIDQDQGKIMVVAPYALVITSDSEYPYCLAAATEEDLNKHREFFDRGMVLRGIRLSYSKQTETLHFQGHLFHRNIADERMSEQRAIDLGVDMDYVKRYKLLHEHVTKKFSLKRLLMIKSPWVITNRGKYIPIDTDVRMVTSSYRNMVKVGVGKLGIRIIEGNKHEAQ